MIKSQIVRKTNKKVLNKLFQKIKNIHDQHVSIGYFKSQGLHSQANMPYANLLYIHAHGLVYGAPVRDVMAHLRPMITGGNSESSMILKLLRDYFNNKMTREEVFSEIGRSYRDKGKSIFGNPSYLEATDSNPTPLVDTKELRDNFAYKTSITMKVVTK